MSILKFLYNFAAINYKMLFTPHALFNNALSEHPSHFRPFQNVFDEVIELNLLQLPMNDH